MRRRRRPRRHDLQVLRCLRAVSAPRVRVLRKRHGTQLRRSPARRHDRSEVDGERRPRTLRLLLRPIVVRDLRHGERSERRQGARRPAARAARTTWLRATDGCRRHLQLTRRAERSEPGRPRRRGSGIGGGDGRRDRRRRSDHRGRRRLPSDCTSPDRSARPRSSTRRTRTSLAAFGSRPKAAPTSSSMRPAARGCWPPRSR